MMRKVTNDEWLCMIVNTIILVFWAGQILVLVESKDIMAARAARREAAGLNRYYRYIRKQLYVYVSTNYCNCPHRQCPYIPRPCLQRLTTFILPHRSRLSWLRQPNKSKIHLAVLALQHIGMDTPHLILGKYRQKRFDILYPEVVLLRNWVHQELSSATFSSLWLLLLRGNTRSKNEGREELTSFQNGML